MKLHNPIYRARITLVMFVCMLGFFAPGTKAEQNEFAVMWVSTGTDMPDINAAAPITLDKFNAYVFPYAYTKSGGTYVGTEAPLVGMPEPCAVRFNVLKNTTTGDGLSFMADLSGALTRAKYPFNNASKNRFDEVEGFFRGNFLLGPGHSLSGGKKRQFYMTSGTMTIVSVTSSYVSGYFSGQGDVGRLSFGDEVPPFSQASVAAIFSIKARNLRTAAPYACLSATDTEGSSLPDVEDLMSAFEADKEP